MEKWYKYQIPLLKKSMAKKIKNITHRWKKDYEWGGVKRETIFIEQLLSKNLKQKLEKERWCWKKTSDERKMKLEKVKDYSMNSLFFYLYFSKGIVIPIHRLALSVFIGIYSLEIAPKNLSEPM